MNTNVKTNILKFCFEIAFQFLYDVLIVTKYNLPLTLGAIQTFIVALFSFLIGLIYEEFIFEKILNEIDSILYAGILSGGFAFVLQI